jgi:hypothetical protein
MFLQMDGHQLLILISFVESWLLKPPLTFGGGGEESFQLMMDNNLRSQNEFLPVNEV